MQLIPDPGAFSRRRRRELAQSVFALSGLLFFFSQYLQLVRGLSPMDAGLLLVPGLVAAVLAGLAAVPLARRVPVRLAWS